MATKLMRGNDRKMLQKFLKLANGTQPQKITGINGRDELVTTADPLTTTRISNRTRIFPAADDLDPDAVTLRTAWVAVQARVVTLLAAVNP